MSKLPRFSSISQAIPNGEFLLRNLRLLDLDEDFDWPAISKDTFAAGDPIQNQKQRVWCAEWVLYKLFEKWNPSEAEQVISHSFCTTLLIVHQNLQPFFPPLEPLQSINLRAALFRSLNELKRNGVLRKEIFVRRSMLDDCKGPRFEEVLAALSTSVIYKILAKDKNDKSIVRQLLLGKQNTVSIDVSLLSVSYRASLMKLISTKGELGQRYRKFGRMLDLKSHEIEQRGQSQLSDSRAWKQKIIPQRTVAKLTEHLIEQWQGDRSWIDILVHGDRFRPRNSLLEQPFDQVWPHVSSDTLYKVRPDIQESLLEDLEGRVSMQNERLQKWKEIKEGLAENTECTGKVVQHHVNDIREVTDIPHPQRIRNSGTFPPRRSELKAEVGTESNASLDSLTTQDVGRVESRHMELQDICGVCVDDTSQTCSLFLAANSSRLLALKDVTGTGIPPLMTDDNSKGIGSSIERTAPQGTKVSASFGLTAGRTPPPQNNLQADCDEPTVRKTSSSVFPIHTHSTQTRLSLAQRTRMSMALVTPSKGLATKEIQVEIAPPAPSPVQRDDIICSPDFSFTDQIQRSATLLDRTRQSMSLLSTTSQGRGRSCKPRTSKVYPINQFNSPGREQPVSETADISTLEELLPDADADYETVFKSRPKIALSPRMASIQDATWCSGVTADDNEADIGQGIN